MYRVRVVDVQNENTIEVWPRWNFDGESGSLVRIRGLRTFPEGSRHSGEARCRLLFLVLGSDVFVTRVQGCADRILECDVSYCGRSLTEHLREYALVEDGVSLPVAENLLGTTPQLGSRTASLSV